MKKQSKLNCALVIKDVLIVKHPEFCLLMEWLLNIYFAIKGLRLFPLLNSTVSARKSPSWKMNCQTMLSN